MKIIRGRAHDSASIRRSDTFTGGVWGDPVLPATDGVLINSVFFEPAARTHWHRHEHGQILCVTSGRGGAYGRDGSGGPIAPGDIVWIAPGEEHWHGAARDSYLVHLAISLGETEWLGEVTDTQFEAFAPQTGELVASIQNPDSGRS
jgi:quercetin dioxygenase-like cupin family protein